MTIAFVNGGAVVWTTANNPTVGYPAGAATDAIVAFAAGKPPAFVATQANYDSLGSCVSGTGGAAVDDGPTRNEAFVRKTSPTGSASDSWAVAGSPSPAHLRTLRFSRSAGVGWLTSYTGLIDADETGTAVVAAAPVAAGQYQAGDMVAITVITKSDAIIHTAQTLSIPGVVLDAVTWFARYLTTTGADGSAYGGYATVLSGASSAGDATYSATSNVSGGSATTVSLARLREDPGGTQTFTGAGAQTVSAVTQVATATHLAPTFVAAASQSVPEVTQTAAATHVPPTSTATAAQTVPAVTQAGSITSGAPGFTATADQTVLAVVQAAASTHVPPTFTATATSIVPAVTQAGEAHQGVPTFVAAISQTVPAVTQVAAAVTVAPPAVAHAAQIVPAVTQLASATATLPVFTATSVQSVPAVTQAAVAAQAAPHFVGAGASTMPKVTQVGVVTFQRPGFFASITQVVAAVTQRADAWASVFTPSNPAPPVPAVFELAGAGPALILTSEQSHMRTLTPETGHVRTLEGP